MNPKKILLTVAAVAIVIILLIVGAFGLVIFDVMGNLASGSEKIGTGEVTGKALVVYNPGISGASTKVARTIADDLNAKGYSVVLAGVKSAAATGTAGCDVIVVGGPIYAGNASSSIAAYMKTLNPPANAKVGVFGTGSSSANINNPAGLKSELTGLPADRPVKVKAAVKVLNTDDVGQKCAAFVDELLK